MITNTFDIKADDAVRCERCGMSDAPELRRRLERRHGIESSTVSTAIAELKRGPK